MRCLWSGWRTPGVGGKVGVREAYIVAETPGGDQQGVQRGVKLPQGIDTPRVDELPQGNETPGLAIKVNGVTGEDGRDQGGDRTPPTTQASKESGDHGSNEAMTCRTRKAAPPHTQQDTEADNESVSPSCSNPTALTVPGPKTACTRAAST